MVQDVYNMVCNSNKKQVNPVQKDGTKGLIYKHPECIPFLDGYNNDINIYNMKLTQKYVYHWKCFRCGYEWDRDTRNGIIKQVCPACQVRLITGFNDYKTKYPTWALDWDTSIEKNGPDKTFYRSQKPVHWKCHVCGHTSLVSPLQTILKQSTCRACNSIDKKWSVIKKYIADIDSIDTARTPGDQVRLLEWTCKNNHRYNMKICDRTTNFHGCPICRGVEPGSENKWFYDVFKLTLKASIGNQSSSSSGDNLAELEELNRDSDVFGISLGEFNEYSKHKLEKYVRYKNIYIRFYSEYCDNREKSLDKKTKSDDNKKQAEKIRLKDQIESNRCRYYEICESSDQDKMNLRLNGYIFTVPMDYQGVWAHAIIEWLNHYSIQK